MTTALAHTTSMARGVPREADDSHQSEAAVGRNGNSGLGRLLTAVTLLGLATTPALEAQVGLNSGIAQIALVVRVPPRVSMLGVNSLGETRRGDNVSEGSVKVRFTANTSYRLIVRA